ncbi:MAG: hypothetical protein PUC37_09990 [Spirochaetales bacterium]|nr:hypothetical protein [Spirochaetales bacterium]
MKHGKSALFILFFFLFLITNLTAKETQIAKDVKKALNSYAGLPELKKRGFNLKSLDSAQTGEDIYNALLPYMIQNGIPLDNVFSFCDKQSYKTYNFKQHYTVHFTDDYGTKEKLLKKGYKEDEIFAYFSKGKDVYRGGHFSWDVAKNFPEIGRWMMPQFPPLVEKNFIYFWPAYWTEKFYPDYWETSLSKAYIIIDLRLDQSGDWQISQFFDYLENGGYKGELIIIVDSSSDTGESLLAYRMTKWQNGKEVPRNFKVTSIGENTLGQGNFSGEWQRFETDSCILWGVRKEVNKWKSYEEGIGIMPDIWAETPEEIFKTVEDLTGIKNFSASTAVYQKFINSLIMQNQSGSNTKLPQAFFDIKDNKLFLDSVSDYLDLMQDYYNRSAFLRSNNLKNIYLPDSLLQIQDLKLLLETCKKFTAIQKKWYDFCSENLDNRSEFIDVLRGSYNNLSVEKYLTALNNDVEISILKSKKAISGVQGDDYLQMLASTIDFKPDVKMANRKLEAVFLMFNKYDILVNEGFDIHKMDYMTKPEEIQNYLQQFFLSKEGYPRDLHTGINITTNAGTNYPVKQTSRYIVFNDEYGTKDQLKKKGYVEDVTMFYYPYHDGKFWTKENNWCTGKMIMAMPNNQYQETEYKNLYYTTKKSVYFKFNSFAQYIGNGPELSDPEIEEMIVRLSKETEKENVIFDISKNPGGFGHTTDRISKAVKQAGIKNVYVVMDKGAFSCADHFPFDAKYKIFGGLNVTLVGYPTMGGNGSGSPEHYIIEFPDFKVYADIATSFTNSETEHEGWGGTPDVYADDMTDALGAIRTLTGDNDIQPFESEERKQFNKGKKRWLENDLIFEIKN